MDAETREHELFHCCSAAVALSGSTRYQDAQVYFETDTKGAGGFLIAIDNYHHLNGVMTDTEIDHIRAKSSIGPLGMLSDNQLGDLFISSKYWSDVFSKSHDTLSQADIRHAMKTFKLHIKSHEDISPIFAGRALRELDFARFKALDKILERRKGIPLMPLKDLIPRDIAIAMRKYCDNKSKLLFQIQRDYAA